MLRTGKRDLKVNCHKIHSDLELLQNFEFQDFILENQSCYIWYSNQKCSRNISCHYFSSHQNLWWRFVASLEFIGKYLNTNLEIYVSMYDRGTLILYHHSEIRSFHDNVVKLFKQYVA